MCKTSKPGHSITAHAVFLLPTNLVLQIW